VKFRHFSPMIIVLLGIIEGCRGYTTSKPPIHPNLNMDTQEKGKAYRESDFFADKQYMRQPIKGTVAYGNLREDEHFYKGIIDGAPARSFPANLIIDETFLERGRLMFNRTCASCHARVGDGNGLVGRRLIVKPTSFHSAYMYGMPPGHFYQVIEKGIRTMLPYANMIEPKDRWAVIAYIRSLQISQDFHGEWVKRSSSWWMQK